MTITTEISSMKDDRPSVQAKKFGFKDLKELSSVTGETEQTLNYWRKRKPLRFKLILKGAVFERLADH
jgi:hypothetical protein